MESLVKASFWRDRPVLVTGCSGLLGTALTQRLLELGAAVTGLVRDDVPRSHFFSSGAAGQSCAEDQDGSAFGITIEFDRTLVSRIGSKPQTGHRMIHSCAAGNCTDQVQQIAPTKG